MDAITQNSRPRRVWIVGSYYLELRLPLMQRLRDSGLDVEAVGQGDQHDLFRDHGFAFHRYPLTRSLNPLSDYRAYRTLTGLLERHRPDIVHAVNTKPGLLAPKAAARANIPGVVRTITGLGGAFSSDTTLARVMQLAYRRLQRRAAKATATTVFQNVDDRDYFFQHHLADPARSVLIPGSGIDVEEFRRRPHDRQSLEVLRSQLGVEGKTVVTMIARIIGSKGVREFAQAAQAIRRRHPSAAFLLVGPAMRGPDGIPAQWLAEQSGHVTYLGQRDDIADLLAISDIFVLPSYFREGIPRVLLEAGALGIPLITTDMPGCREVVTDGVNGFVIEPRDSDAIARSVNRLLLNPSLRKTMGSASRQRVEERFHLRHVADAYMEIYRRVLAQSLPQRRAA